MTTSPFISAALLIATLTACASAPLPGCTVYVTQAQALLYQGVSLTREESPLGCVPTC